MRSRTSATSLSDSTKTCPHFGMQLSRPGYGGQDHRTVSLLVAVDLACTLDTRERSADMDAAAGVLKAWRG